MPRKIRPDKMLIRKQKMLIDSRLMQISLKVDEYVYRKKPITVSNAAMFITEVSGYKDKRFDDKRTLQVIEKLVRCMKGIIAEQSDVEENAQADDVVIETAVAGSVDEDFTQFAPDIDVTEILDSPKKYIAEIDFERNNNINTHLTGDVQLNEIMNRHDDNGVKNKKDVIENKIKNDGSSNEHLQRAISNLTIADDDDPLLDTPFISEDCSQSILKDVNFYNESEEQLKTNQIVYQDFDTIIQPATIAKEHTNDKVSTNETLISMKRNCILNLPNIFISDNNSDPAITPNTPTAKTSGKTCDSKEKVKRKRNQKIKQKSEQQKKNKPRKKTLEQNVTGIKSSKVPEESFKTSEIPYKSVVTTDQNQRPNDNPIQFANAKMGSHPKSLLPNSVANPIYNKHVENDLSWIENIRFVREITPEEKVPAYFEDSFWENYLLPDVWNDNDFLYT